MMPFKTVTGTELRTLYAEELYRDNQPVVRLSVLEKQSLSGS